jgi:hypothetical protein
MIDSPIFLQHPDLAAGNIHATDNGSGACSLHESIACPHGTFVAGYTNGGQCRTRTCDLVSRGSVGLPFGNAPPSSYD